MKSAGKARNNGLYRHIRTSKEIIRNLLNDSSKKFDFERLNYLYSSIYDSEYIDVKALDTLTPANFCVLQDKS